MSFPIDQPAVPVDSSDLDLLRRFEPIGCFTKGEVFFPVNVEAYIQECSLWAHHVDGEDEMLIKQGDLTVERLLNLPAAGFGTIHYLRFIETLNLTDAAHVLAEQLRIHFNKPDRFFADVGRLARGGFLPRIADALFSLTLLLRGRVPAATAAAAELAYLQMMGDPAVASGKKANIKPQYYYYGRVKITNTGWIVLQYWYFYCYNNWRSGFQGVNDHEADWENVNIYLYQQDGYYIPEWVAYASHDAHGDDLRRRWNDGDQLSIVEGHPVIHVGAGSHASYFRRGEYQAEISLPIPNWLRLIVQGWRRFWTEVLDQQISDPFRIPFVDYARGDGIRIGSSVDKPWNSILIDEKSPWVSQFRGLWGLFARDPISGENAPAGPMYNRDGTPRAAWYDPVGYVGLDKVPPPTLARKLLEAECDRISSQASELEEQIDRESMQLQSMGTRLKGMQGRPHLAKQYDILFEQVDELSRKVNGLRREFTEEAILLESLQVRLNDLLHGIREDARAHIKNLVEPVRVSRARFDRAIEAWASISLGLLLVGAAGLLLFTPGFFWGGMLVLVVVFLMIEAGLRGGFSQTISRITATLSLLSLLLILIHFWKQVIALALLIAAIYLLTQRLRELRGRAMNAMKK